MNIKRLAIVGTLATTFSLQAVAETNSPNIDVLTGDARTACEVILCLSSANGRGISECQPPIRKYFSIRAKKWSDTLRKRRKFLDLCPAANENAKMSALTTAIQNQEHACDTATLNTLMKTRVQRVRNEEGYSRYKRMVQVNNQIPNFCNALYEHEFTEYNLKKPKYVCDTNKWYSREDWERGYTQEIVSRKWNRYTESYDYTYKQVPIKKDCWE